jgi:hypothetical protein
MDDEIVDVLINEKEKKYIQGGAGAPPRKKTRKQLHGNNART